jgi:hypothetical protein
MGVRHFLLLFLEVFLGRRRPGRLRSALLVLCACCSKFDSIDPLEFAREVVPSCQKNITPPVPVVVHKRSPIQIVWAHTSCMGDLSALICATTAEPL